jgi:hypothetical protein
MLKKFSVMRINYNNMTKADIHPYKYFLQQLHSFQNKVLEKVSLKIHWSIFMDEWTNCRNRRYMTTLVHYNETSLNLGLIRIHGNYPA